MPVCARCGKDTGLLGSLNYNKQMARCGKCESEVKAALTRFRQAFLSFTYDGILTPQQWDGLLAGAAGDRLDINEALAFVRGDAMNLLERMVSFAFADGFITDDEEWQVHQLRQVLQIPDVIAEPIVGRLNYLKYITSIRLGRLPTVQASPGMHFDSDEICHLEIDATYRKVNPKSVSLVPGRFVATGKKLLFLSGSGGAEIPWKNIVRVEQQPGAVYLELSVKKGNGRYDVSDALLVSSVIETLVRIAKRQLLVPQADSDSRHIPQEVRTAVWQRDQGKCRQCGATSYLEFDHIIPFSKGGASTVGNVQLLCRRCNLQKSDRI